jgi:ligand-binding sensor domain-containing protein
MLRSTAVYLLIALFATGARATSETGRLHTEEFTTRDFGQMNRSSGLAQDRAGLLYVGNHDAVVVFDGQTWQTIRTGGSFIQELACDRDDRLWIAGVEDYGVLENNGVGGRAFTSLRETVPAIERDFGYMLGVETSTHGTYFFASSAILRWHADKMTVMSGRRGLPCVVRDLVFAQNEQGVLESFDGSHWRVFADTPEIRRNRITALLPDGDTGLLVCTAREGVWRWEEGRFVSFRTDIDDQLHQTGEHVIDRLRDGTLLVRLASGGLAFLDTNGRLLHLLDTNASGRPLPRIRSVVQDEAGDIWIAHSDGIARITWPATFTLFDQANGLLMHFAKDVKIPALVACVII